MGLREEITSQLFIISYLSIHAKRFELCVNRFFQVVGCLRQLDNIITGAVEMLGLFIRVVRKSQVDFFNLLQPGKVAIVKYE